MGPPVLRANLFWFIIMAAFLFPFQAKGQAQSHLTFCLNSAMFAELNAFKLTKKYILKEDELRNKISAGCAALNYDFVAKGKSGIQVISELNGETWAVDENSNLIKVHSHRPPAPIAKSTANSAPPPIGPPPPPASAPPEALAPPTPPVSNEPAADPVSRPSIEGGAPLAVLATNDGASAESHPTELVPVTPANGPPAPLAPAKTVINANDVDMQKKMERCFAKISYTSKLCTNFFADLETRCKGTPPYPTICGSFQKSVNGVPLEDCVNPQDNFGRCEFRKAQLERKCANQLQQQSTECRDYAKFQNASKEPSGNTFTRILERIEKVTESTPVSTPAPKPGFVDKIPERTPSNETLDERSRQLSASLTTGIQELVIMCKTTEDRQKEILRRVLTIEQETENTKKENGELKKRLDEQVKNIESIKAKLGLK